MFRSRRVAIITSIAASLAVAWSLGWLVQQLTPIRDTGRLAYKPVENLPPRVDLGRVQQQWPNALNEPGDHNRLIAYQQDNAQAAQIAPATVRGGSVVVPLVDLGTLLANADVGAGKARAQVCAGCHDLNRGGPDRVGPNLWGVIGRNVASRPSFSYSSAMAAQQGVWSYARLFTYLASPARAVPGNKMGFAGIANPQDRAAVIRYLATRSDNPAALPRPQAATGARKIAGN